MDRSNRPHFIHIPPRAKMCCFPLKRRCPPSSPSDHSLEECVATPSPSPRSNKIKHNLQNFFFPPTPLTTPDSYKHSNSGKHSEELNPFEKACASTTAPPGTVSSVTLAPSTPTTPHLRALLVDDNIVNLQILERSLQSSQFSSIAIISPKSFTSPLEALIHLEEVDYDIILLDIDMPEMSGVETALAIRGKSKSNSIRAINKCCPIVAVTTNDGPAARKTYKEAGMLACVGKPLNVAELRAVINEVVGRLE